MGKKGNKPQKENKSYNRVGHIIRIHRERNNMKVYELAKKVGVNPVYVTQIEKHNKLPSLKVITKIADIFKLPAILRRYAEAKYPEIIEISKELSARSEKEYILKASSSPSWQINAFTRNAFKLVLHGSKKTTNKLHANTKRNLKKLFKFYPNIIPNDKTLQQIENILLEVKKHYFETENIVKHLFSKNPLPPEKMYQKIEKEYKKAQEYHIERQRIIKKQEELRKKPKSKKIKQELTELRKKRIKLFRKSYAPFRWEG